MPLPGVSPSRVLGSPRAIESWTGQGPVLIRHSRLGVNRVHVAESCVVPDEASSLMPGRSYQNPGVSWIVEGFLSKLLCCENIFIAEQ
jgi:hypothetical protein